MSYSSRVYRHRNAHNAENKSDNEQQSFFSKSGKQSGSGKSGKPFFQAKLTVNQPGDKQEREADDTANSVVQRLATSAGDEAASTDEERMKEDKEIQTKPDLQRKCAECEKEEKG